MKNISKKQAQRIGNLLKVNWDRVNLEEFRRGIEVELEHGTIYPNTDITKDNLITTAKIALAHLRELHNYYSELDQMESTNLKEEGFAEPPNTTAKGITLEMVQDIAIKVGIDFSKYQIEDLRYGIIEELGLMEINTMENVDNETMGKATYRAHQNLSQDPAYYAKDMGNLEQQHLDPSIAKDTYELNKMVESIVKQELRKHK
jgi:hypothetical protein